jgi:hypothetical protein
MRHKSIIITPGMLSGDDPEALDQLEEQLRPSHPIKRILEIEAKWEELYKIKEAAGQLDPEDENYGYFISDDFVHFIKIEEL